MMRKTQILTWAVVLLLVTNAVTIGTIFYHNYRESKKSDDVVITGSYGGNMINGRFLRQTLGFDQSQMSAFREINQAFRPAAMSLTFEIDSLKNAMFNEMQKNQPDTLVLNSMSVQIGELHGQLKYETYSFYLNTKKICSPEQRPELEKIFQPLFINEGITTAPNQHRGRGWEKNKTINNN